MPCKYDKILKLSLLSNMKISDIQSFKEISTNIYHSKTSYLPGPSSFVVQIQLQVKLYLY
jgi:hypothetical protein